MPQQFTQEDIDYMVAHGIDPSTAQIVQPPAQNIGTGQTIASTLKAHGGGLVGGGVGTLGGLAAASWLLGPEAGIPATIAASLAGGTIGGAAGGYVGQKAQEAITPEETYARLQQEAQAAQEANPKTALATDIIAGSLAAGGRPTADVFRAGKGLIGKLGGEELSEAAKKALASTAIGAAVNPAIQTGMSLAQGQGIPSAGDLAASAAGGAIFSKQFKWANKLTGHIEPSAETTDSTPEQPAPLKDEPLGDIITPYTKIDERTGNYAIGNKQIKNLYLRSEGILKTIPKDADPVTKAELQTYNDDIRKINDYDMMRDYLHRNEMGEMAKRKIFTESPTSGLENAQEELPARWTDPHLADEPAPEISSAEPISKALRPTVAPVSNNAKDFTAAKIEDFANQGMRSGVAREEVMPKVNPVVEAAKVRDRAARQDNTQPKTPAELAAEQFEQKGNVNAMPVSEHGDFGIEHILHPAVKDDETGKVYGNPSDAGTVHYTIRERNNIKQGEDGFVTSTGRFLNRDRAVAVAKQAGQLTDKAKLPSERFIFGLDTAHLKRGYHDFNTMTRDPSNSPLSDYNRYQELVKQLSASKDMNATIGLQQELHNIMNKYGGNPPPRYPEGHVLMPVAIQHHITTGKATTGSILQALANTENHPFQEVAKHLLNIADTKSLGVKWQHDNTLDQMNSAASSKYGTNRSHYSPSSDVVRVSTGAAGDARVVIEEAVHSLTSKKIPHFSGQGYEYHQKLLAYLQKKGGNETVKNIIRTYLDTAKALKIEKELFEDEKDPMGRNLLRGKGLAGNADKSASEIRGVSSSTGYAMGNLDEFIAQAIKNPDFQRVLAKIKVNGHENVLSKLFRHIAEMLGWKGEKDGTMLQRVLGHSDELIAQNSPDVLTDEAGEAYRTSYDNVIEPMTKMDRSKYMEATDKLSPSDSTEDKLTELRDIFNKQGHFSKSQIDALVNHQKLFYQQRGEGLFNKPPSSAPPTAKSSTPDDPHMGKFGNLFRAMIDKISDIPHPTARYLAGAFKKTLNEREQLRGQWTNSILSTAKKYDLSDGDKKMLSKVADYENMNKKSGMFMLKNNAQRQAYLAERKAHDEAGKLQQKYNIPVYDKSGVPRAIKLDPFHHAWTMEPKVVDILKTGTDVKAIEQYHQDFLDNAIKNYHQTPVKAEALWQELRSNTQGSSKNNAPNMEHFAGSRIAQGIPLPESMRRADWLRNQEVYYNRLALNHAYYHNVESDPKVLGVLNVNKDPWNKPIAPDPDGSLAGNAAVRHQLDEFHGEKGGAMEHNENAISAMATGLAIASPGLEIHKVISNIVGAFSTADNPVQFAKMLGSAVSNIRDGYQHSIDNGITHMTANGTAKMLDQNSTFAERLQGLAQGVRNLTTAGGLTTKFNDGLMQAGMEYLIPSKIEKANSGNKQARDFLANLDPDYTPGKKYSPEDVNKLASLAVGYIHGTGDGRSLPAWMTHDSEVSGFFKLAHWSISQTNRFMKDIYKPATQGEYAPLVMSIFGSAIGGYMIKEMREKLQGKKYQLPDLEDIANSERGLSGNAGLLAYNAIAASQYAGFGGILSQIARYPFDIAYKSQPQGAMFPLDEITSDVANTISEAATAAANDPHVNWLHLTQNVFEHLLKTDFTLARMAINQGINNGLITGLPAEKKILGDKLQNLRKFQMTSGLPFNSMDEGTNPYMNIEQKRFHMETDPQKAVAMLPDMIDTIIQKYSDNPDIMMGKLKALKDSSYPSMPDMENYPLEFHKYMNYLNRQEEGKGNEFLRDFITRKTINSIKSSVVP